MIQLILVNLDRWSVAGYDERGYHHTINGIAAVGREKDAIELGKMYGLSLTEVKNALGDVRNRRTFGSKTIEGKTLSQVLSEMRDAKQKKTVVQQQQQQSDDPKPTTTFTAEEVQKNIDLDDDFTYGDDNNDSDGGVSQILKTRMEIQGKLILILLQWVVATVNKKVMSL